MPKTFLSSSSFFFMGIAAIALLAELSAAVASPKQPTDPVTESLNGAQSTRLAGNVHPLARPEYDLGAVPPETRLEKMVLVLRPTAKQQMALDALSRAQQDQNAPEFHHWLTPAEYGSRFGASSRDLAKIFEWLVSCGFSVDEIAASRLLVTFSGTAGQVAGAFHTELHAYRIPVSGADGLSGTEIHIANAQDPQIPSALAGVVQGVLSLHDFRRKSSMENDWIPAAPGYTRAGSSSVSPSEFAMVYDLPPLYNSGIQGAGVTIAIVSRLGAVPGDAIAFRKYGGFPENLPTVPATGADPELVPGDEDQATMDEAWAGSIAPRSNVHLVPSTPTATTDGADLSAQYIVNHAAGQVLSSSFSSCEEEMGASELYFYRSLWQQAAAEGISSFVSAAGVCGVRNDSDASAAKSNGLCQSPYVTCVMEPTSADDLNLADGRLPPEGTAVGEAEESGATADVPAVLLAAGGGENGIGTHETNKEGSLDGSSRRLNAAPAFAAIMALVVEENGGAGLGNVNPELKLLLRGPRQSSGSVAPLRFADGAQLVDAWTSRAKGQRATLRDAAVDPVQSESKHQFVAVVQEEALPASQSGASISVASYAPDPTGLHDSTAAFQKAFDAATSSVVIPPGTYLLGCTNPLYLSRNNIAYLGAGQTQTILRSCQGHSVAVTSWTCVPASGSSCTTGKGPFTLTIKTSTPLLKGIDDYYCPQNGSSNSCTLITWHGEFPGGQTLDEQFTLSGAGLPSVLSTALANPVFACGAGCGVPPTGQTTFTIQSTIAPTANSGSGGTFSLPQNVLQAYDPRSNTHQVGSKFSNITFDGGCNQCKSTSFDTALIELGNPRTAARVVTANAFSNITFSNYAAVAVRVDRTDGDSFNNIVFTNAGQSGITGDSPNNLSIDHVTATNFGWQTDVRVIGPGTIYSSAFNFGCNTGGHGMQIQNVSMQPSRNSNFVGFGIWCGNSTVQTETTSAYSNVQIANFTIQSAGNRLLPVSAFADYMTIHGFRIQGPPDPAQASDPYMEIAGSDLNLYENQNVGFYFAPIDEGGQNDAGLPKHTHFARIAIHDNTLNCTAPTGENTGCFGVAIGGFQNSLGDSVVSYIDTVKIYNNTAHYTFGSVNQGNVVHIALGGNEGGSGFAAGQLTNVHVYNESVSIAGSQAMGGGWSAFAILFGNNKANANWKFEHDKVTWTNTKTSSSLNHLRAMKGVVASHVEVQEESTPVAPHLLTDMSGGSFAGITVVP